MGVITFKNKQPPGFHKLNNCRNCIHYSYSFWGNDPSYKEGLCDAYNVIFKGDIGEFYKCDKWKETE